MSRERLRQIFIEEASEIIEKLDSDVMDLESDPGNSDTLNELFRGVHTLKGSANSIGFTRLGTFVHSFEDALDYYRAGQGTVNTAVIDTFLDAVDVIKDVFDDEVQERSELTHPARYEQSLEHIRQLLVRVSPTEETGSAAAEDTSDQRPSQTAYREVLRDLAEEFASVPEEHDDSTDSASAVGGRAPSEPGSREGADHIDLGELQSRKGPGEHLYHIQLTLDSDIYIRGYDHAIFLRLLREQGSILSVRWDLSRVSHLSDIDPLRCDIGIVDIYMASDHPQGEIEEIFEFLDDFEYRVRVVDDETSEPASIAQSDSAPAPTPAPSPAAPVTAAATSPDEGHREPPAPDTAASAPPTAPAEASTELPTEPPTAPESADAIAAAPTALAAESEVEADRAAERSAPANRGRDEKRSFVRIDTKKLDELFDSVGELVIAQSFLTQNPTIQDIADEHVKKTLDVLSKITRLIQNRVMSLRMVPIRDTFEKMRRVVRDASRKIDKDIVLHISGEDTEIDKNMVDALGDPLIHLIRNAIDHGIESDPAERTLHGKPIQGNIFLRAFHKGGSIVIEISDDGRGINREKVLHKAIRQGLVSAEEELSDTQVYSLIMQAGFSTAEAISDLSGRGVGLDVVRSSVEQLRGKVEIQSMAQQGTTFSLQLPLTLAIIDGMLVRCAHETFIIPTLSILESFQPSNDSVFTYQGKGEFVKLREEILPIVRLDEVLNIRAAKRLKAAEATLVHVENDNGHFALLVDELISRQQVVIKPIGEGSIRVPQVSGAAVMGNGMVSLILNVEGLY